MRPSLNAAGFVALALASLTLAAQQVRQQEMAQCLPGEIVTWGDGRDRPANKVPLVFLYDHSAAPDWFSEEQVLAAVQRSALAWSACGVPNAVQRFKPESVVPDGAVIVQWSEKNSGGNFAQADLGRGLLAMSPAMFRLLNTRNPAHDARETLQMVIAHEMGHHLVSWPIRDAASMSRPTTITARASAALHAMAACHDLALNTVPPYPRPAILRAAFKPTAPSLKVAMHRGVPAGPSYFMD